MNKLTIEAINAFGNVIPDGMRVCRVCGTILPFDAQHFRIRKATGRSSYECRECEDARLQKLKEREASEHTQRVVHSPSGIHTIRECRKCGKELPLNSANFLKFGRGFLWLCNACSNMHNKNAGIPQKKEIPGNPVDVKSIVKMAVAEIEKNKKPFSILSFLGITK